MQGTVQSARLKGHRTHKQVIAPPDAPHCAVAKMRSEADAERGSHHEMINTPTHIGSAGKTAIQPNGFAASTIKAQGMGEPPARGNSPFAKSIPIRPKSNQSDTATPIKQETSTANSAIASRRSGGFEEGIPPARWNNSHGTTIRQIDITHATSSKF